MIAGRRAVPLLLAVAGAALAAQASGSAYALHVLTIAGIFALLAMGYQFIFGHAGALALSQGSFMGVGAYVSGILAARCGLGFGAALPFSLGAPLLLALATAIPVLRLRTHYFALATLIIAQIMLLVATQWESVTGGANGIGGIGPLALLGRPVRSGWSALALVWALVALGGLLAWRLTAGRLGAAFALLRRDAAAAAACGIDAARLRLLGFLLSAGYAGLAGSLYAHVIGVISPEILSFPVMVTCLTIVVVGGPRRVAGAIAGAVLVIELPEWFRGLREWYLLAYGAALLLAVTALPDGLVGAAERLAERLRPTPGAPPQRPRKLPPPAPAPAGMLLRVEEVSCSFGGVRALDAVSCCLRPGEVLGLIGPNGSGKSTLLNVISGHTRPASGRVVFAASDVTTRRPHEIARLGLARGFQTPALVEEMSALDNVALAREAAGLGFGRALMAASADLRRTREEAMALLAELGASADAGVPARVLPPGVRRRVEIARALALRPRVLLLDEPAAGLNPSEQADLAARLLRVAAGGVGLLLVEHNMGFLARLATRMLCLDQGRVIAAGSPAMVRADPGVIAAYLGSAAGP